MDNSTDSIADLHQASAPHEFPIKERKALPVDDYQRMIVHHWDDDYIYGVIRVNDAESFVRVCYTHGSRPYHYDWSYLRQLFYPEAHLNLIHPRLADGILYPELIIFEPDYLVDISTVAHCFTEYAESPLVHLVDRFRPSQQSEAIMMGHLAGQMLDEQVHSALSQCDYTELIHTFWQRHSVSLLTTDIGPGFHDEARREWRNIAHALHDTLPQEVSDYRPGEGVIEPSFFSEMLGLQGRMDYLQFDFKLLLELKSGKGAYHRDGNLRPHYKDAHYIQMLLYMMMVRYNFSELYHAGGDRLHAFLLYSKYPESLIGLGFDSRLMFRAIRLRNRLAWMEMHYLSDDNKGYRILETLTPEKLNQKHCTGRLWTEFRSRELAAILSPIHTATSLERSYYFRFMKFIGTEHRLAKVGHRHHRRQNGGFAGRWYVPAAERCQAGVLWDALRLVHTICDSAGSVTGIRLRFPESTEVGLSRFRRGDIVVAYSYTVGTQPDIRRSLVHRATIESIDADTLNLRLRAPQGDAAVFLRESNRNWAVEPDFMESSFSSLYRGMHAFLSAPRERRDLIVTGRRPAVDRTITLHGDYGEMNGLVLRVRRARDLYLIVGPPGTGKTSRGLVFTLREELLHPDSSVLLMAYTNQAVDAICSNLVNEGVDYVRLGSETGCHPAFRNHLLSHRASTYTSREALCEMLVSVRIFVSTTTSMTSHIALLGIKSFSLAIVDEASQIPEPHLMPLICATQSGSPAIGRFVLIGDHKQLPAVVSQSIDESGVAEPELRAIGLSDCRRSLFERLYSIYHADPDVTYMLRRQGRMHPDIAQFPNEAFYGGCLDVVPLPHQCVPSVVPTSSRSMHGIDYILSSCRVAFVHHTSSLPVLSEGINADEADMITATAVRIYVLCRPTFDSARTLGVIVPYRVQAAAIRYRLSATGIPALRDVTVDTVERFQGSQRDTIIYGTTVQTAAGLSFLTEGKFRDVDGCLVDRRLNVAMTRAMNHLLIIGDAYLLSEDVVYRRLIQYLRGRDAYFETVLETYIRGDFAAADTLGISS